MTIYLLMGISDESIIWPVAWFDDEDEAEKYKEILEEEREFLVKKYGSTQAIPLGASKLDPDMYAGEGLVGYYLEEVKKGELI